MFESLTLFRLADALARHSGARQSEIARNVANSDTPRFRASDIAPFAEALAEPAEFELHRTKAAHVLSADQDSWRRIDAPDGLSPNGNTVSVESQMLKAAEVRQAHEMALGVYAVVSRNWWKLAGGVISG